MKLTAEEQVIVARFEALDAAIAKTLFEADDASSSNPDLVRLRDEMRSLKAKYPDLYKEAFGMGKPS